MYERFFGFRERPFDLTPSPRFLVMTEGHREALSNLEYAISSRKGITVLLGDAGCGKTTIIRTAIDRQPSQVRCVHVTNPALTREEFVETLATLFGLSAEAAQSKATLLRELEEMLRQRRAEDETTVLVVDEAQSLSPDLLEEIRLLANIETSEEKLLSLILAGQPELAEQLNQPSLRQFKQRIALRCELNPLTPQETLAYLAGRIRAAGGVASRVFSREAATLLHMHSGGVPRVINVLADNSLLAAFGRQSKQVTAAVVTEVARDFNLTPTEAIDASVDISTHRPGVHRSGEPSAQPATPIQQVSLLPIPAIQPENDPTPHRDDEESAATGTPLFKAFSAARRFSFLGRRGTA
jgi:general secretion pathway protein A